MGKLGLKACVASDLAHRAQLQNKLAQVCEEMCKEVGAYPKCDQCPKFVEPDSTPGVMTWPELLEHMDNLVAWGQDSIKGWHKQASAIQMAAAKGEEQHQEKACEAADLKNRVQFQNKLAQVCEEMCKEVGAYPKCDQCPKFVEPDSTPGVMTWPELLEHMDNLVAWGQESIKGWHKQASALQVAVSKLSDKSCVARDSSIRAMVQNRLASFCEDMCKEVGALKCTCPNWVEPDSTPGVMTWPEVLEHMGNLKVWGEEQAKGWHKMNSAIQVSRAHGAQGESACQTADLQQRVALQNKLAKVCEEMCKEVGAYP